MAQPKWDPAARTLDTESIQRTRPLILGLRYDGINMQLPLLLKGHDVSELGPLNGGICK